MRHAVRYSRPAQLLLAASFVFVSALSSPRAQNAASAPAPEPTAQQRDFFETQIRPVLATQCYSCHTAAKLAGLSLGSREDLLKGGVSGPAIVPGDPARSVLIQSIRHSGELKMPKGAPQLTSRQIADFEQWITEGAYWPAAAPQPVETSTARRYSITAAQRAFWAFQPLADAVVPEVRDRAWPLNDIDRFVLARLEKEGLKPAPMADRRTLLRRVTYDLTGLMPTYEEVQAFERDTSANAYEKVVDRLLASPRYGERWTRHWLDLVRYGEDNYNVGKGMNQRTDQFPFAYTYRDWVIRALNNDISYGDFVKAQLAADLLPEGVRDENIPALGMHGLGVWQRAANPPEVERADEWNDKVDVTTRAFLGLTVACARCHNHKYDPIPIEDFYRLAGVFQSSQFRAYPQAPKDVVADYDAKKKAIADKEAELKKFMTDASELHAQALFRRMPEYMVAAWRAGNAPVEDVAASAGLDRETVERYVRFVKKAPVNYPDLKPWQAMVARGGTEAEARALAVEFHAKVTAAVAARKQVDEENAKGPQNNPANAKYDILPNGERRRLPVPGFTRTQPKGLARELVYLIRDVFEEDLAEYPAYVDSLVAGPPPPGLLEFSGDDLRKRVPDDWARHLTALESELADLKKALPVEYPVAFGLEEHPEPANVNVHLRGSPYALHDEAPRGYLSVLSGPDTQDFKHGSGRFELAERIVAEPLAQRVIVNRIWRWHFGTGIVNTPSNFGQVGERPSHPELLEYLTRHFVSTGMSWKTLHKFIVMSRTYQLASNIPDIDSPNVKKDPQNRLYWRGNSRRLEGEGLWDVMLLAAGKLDLQRTNGPSLPLTADMVHRAVLAKVSRMNPSPFQVIWDVPNASISSEARFETNVPLQRLYFLNNDVVHDRAEAMAGRAAAAADDLEDQLQRLYQFALQRDPLPAELRAIRQTLANRAAAADQKAALRVASWSLLASNEFLFVE